ncbi:unnamed protein product, partial [marine sediment metagenome]
SPKLKDILGYEPEEVLGKTPFDIMTKEDAERVGAEFASIVESRRPFSIENINIHKDGRLVTLETSGVPILDKNGELQGYRGMDRDITVRKKMEEEMARKEKLALVGTLAGGIAHEIRNPLSVIKTTLDFFKLQLGLLADESLQEYIQIMDQELEGTNQIISDVLDFSRVKTPKKEPVSLENLIKKNLEPIPMEGFELDVQVPADLPEIYADAYQISQVLRNLFANAVQAMTDGGSLKITADVKGEKVVVNVIDTGLWNFTRGS